MSWIDEVRLNIAKRKAEEEVKAEAERAQRVRERAAFEAEQKDRFARRIEQLLPRGVELVSVFFHDQMPGGRLHVGDGVQFDLVRSREQIIFIIPNPDPHHFMQHISAYEAGSDRRPANRLASKSCIPGIHSDYFVPFGKSEIEELLLTAWEKHNAKRETR